MCQDLASQSLLLSVLCAGPDVKTDLRGHILAMNEEGFKRDLIKRHQGNRLSDEDIKLLRSYIERIRDIEVEGNFHTILSGVLSGRCEVSTRLSIDLFAYFMCVLTPL